MDTKIDSVGRQLVMNASRSMIHEAAAFRYLMGMGLNDKDIRTVLRKVGVFTKIRIHKEKA
jgi:hypothetical protein